MRCSRVTHAYFADPIPEQLDDRPFALHVIHNLRCKHALVCQAHLRCERAVRHPFGRIPRSCLLQHAIDLLERQTFGFENEKVGVDEAAAAKAAPHEEHLGTEIPFVRVDHVGCDNADDLKSLISSCQSPRLEDHNLRSSIANWKLSIEPLHEIGSEVERFRQSRPKHQDPMWKRRRRCRYR